MNKKSRVLIIVAIILIFVGIFMITGVINMLHWDFKKLSTISYEARHYDLSADFQSIRVETDTARVTLLPSEDGTASVDCYEYENAGHAVTIEEGCLVISLRDTQPWYARIGIFLSAPEITVTVPAGNYDALSIASKTGDIAVPKAFQFGSISIEANTGSVTSYASASEEISIRTSTGSIQVGDITAGKLTLSATTGSVTASDICCREDISIQVSTGHTKLSQIRCEDLTSSGSTGKVELQNVVAEAQLSITRSTGDVKLAECDAGQILIETSTGNVTGILLSEKVFFTKTDTGHITVPKTTAGGTCRITTSTGNIRIDIAN